MQRRSPKLLAIVLALAAACEPLGELGAHADSAHEAYARALERSGLAYTALGQDWLRAAEQALARPLAATVPLQEEGYFSPERPAAVAYRIELPRGQRVSVHATLLPDASGRLFIDLFTPGDSAGPPRRVASADSMARSLEFEPRRSDTYLLRIQPELLRGGRYTLLVRAAPALAFPVSGAGRRNVQSLFGAARDAGARSHQGVDIFAARGTAVLAASAGRVTRVEETPIGGRVVWLRDEQRGHSLYYAHLDSQYVRAGSAARVGDTLGTVGTTGNARGTPPHLHFGIYRRGEGAIDPLPFLWVPDTVPPRPGIDTTRLGRLLRVRNRATLRAAPRAAAGPIADLEARSIVRAAGGMAGWYRVELPDGRGGFLPAAALEAAHTPLLRHAVPAGLELRDAPRPNAALIRRLAGGGELGVLGTWGRFAYVEVDSLKGWVPAGS